MKCSETSSVEELQAVTQFQRLREILMSPQYADHRKRPLAYWALPTDRRLPLAFLGRTLDDLLSTPFAELTATPGVGQKKIRSFVKLLSRAAQTDPAELPVDLIPAPSDGEPPASTTGESNGFDPSAVSAQIAERLRAEMQSGDEKPVVLNGRGYNYRTVRDPLHEIKTVETEAKKQREQAPASR